MADPDPPVESYAVYDDIEGLYDLGDFTKILDYLDDKTHEARIEHGEISQDISDLNATLLVAQAATPVDAVKVAEIEANITAKQTELAAKVITIDTEAAAASAKMKSKIELALVTVSSKMDMSINLALGRQMLTSEVTKHLKVICMDLAWCLLAERADGRTEHRMGRCEKAEMELEAFVKQKKQLIASQKIRRGGQIIFGTCYR